MFHLVGSVMFGESLCAGSWGCTEAAMSRWVRQPSKETYPIFFPSLFAGWLDPLTCLCIHNGQMQHVCTIWPDLMAANYLEIQNTFFKKQKYKAVSWKRSFKCRVSVERFWFVYLWLYRLVLCFVTISSKAFIRTSLRMWRRFLRLTAMKSLDL